MLSDSLAVYYLLQGVSVPEHSTEPPTKPFDGLRWADEKSLVWTVPAEGNMAEYIGLMFDEIGEALGVQTDAGLIDCIRINISTQRKLLSFGLMASCQKRASF